LTSTKLTFTDYCLPKSSWYTKTDTTHNGRFGDAEKQNQTHNNQKPQRGPS